MRVDASASENILSLYLQLASRGYGNSCCVSLGAVAPLCFIGYEMRCVIVHSFMLVGITSHIVSGGFAMIFALDTLYQPLPWASRSTVATTTTLPVLCSSRTYSAARQDEPRSNISMSFIR